MVLGILPLSSCTEGDQDSIPGLGPSPGEGNGNPLQCFCLENLMDKGVWGASVHGVAKSCIWLSNYIFTYFTFFHIYIWIYIFHMYIYTSHIYMYVHHTYIHTHIYIYINIIYVYVYMWYIYITLLYLKWVTNKGLLYSTGSSVQYYVTT